MSGQDFSAAERLRIVERREEWLAVEDRIDRALGRTALRLLVELMEGAAMPSELSQRLKICTASVTGAVDRAEQKGLVERVRVTLDRRSVQVRLTDKGLRMLSVAFLGKEAA